MLQAIWNPRKKLDLNWKGFVLRILEAIENRGVPSAVAILANGVPAVLDERPELPYELTIEGLNDQHDIQILGGSKWLIQKLHGNGCCHPANQNVATLVVFEILSNRSIPTTISRSPSFHPNTFAPGHHAHP